MHVLADILIIGILSVIAGGNGWEDMENYGLSKSEWLEQFLVLPQGIPSADTFRRVFERIKPLEERALLSAMDSINRDSSRGTSDSHRREDTQRFLR